jgi:hypothetical protein
MSRGVDSSQPICKIGTWGNEGGYYLQRIAEVRYRQGKEPRAASERRTRSIVSGWKPVSNMLTRKQRTFGVTTAPTGTPFASGSNKSVPSACCTITQPEMFLSFSTELKYEIVVAAI